MMARQKTDPWTTPTRGKLPIDTEVWVGRKSKAVPVMVHEFRIHDEEDPDLYAAEPIIEWQKSEVGKWVMERAVDTPEWWRTPDVASFSHKYKIMALLQEEDAVYFNLKWR